MYSERTAHPANPHLTPLTPQTTAFINGKFPNSAHLPAGCLEDKDLPAPRLNCLSQSTFKYVCVLHRVPPWEFTVAKLNLYSPLSLLMKRGLLAGSSPLSLQTSPVSVSHPARGAFKTTAPQSPVQLPCYCPLIYCSQGGGGWEGRLKELGALYIRDIVIWQWASY